MVLVEFFDREPLDNMIGCLSMHPDKVYFVGESKLIKRQLKPYRDFLARRKIMPQFEVRSVMRNNLDNILSVITEIVESENECCFDLTGGDDMLLVAVGIVYQKYKDTKKLALHRYNVRKNTVALCEKGDDLQLESYRPAVTVEESIALHGGAVTSNFKDGKRTESWNYTPEFISDVEAMWEIARKDPSEWNSQIGILAGFEAVKFPGGAPLEVCVSLSDRKNIAYVKRLLNALYKIGLIYELIDDIKTISYIYKNQQVKRCLLKAGNVLELKTLLSARRLKNADGTDFYSDSTVQVCIDWDGNFHNYGDMIKDTENEIDVMFMKELVPVFVSCKNGFVGDDELYKLNTVASRFGGRYAKKVLVATHLGKKGEGAKYFRQRAKDMNIILIDDAHLLNDEQFEQSLRNIVL